MHSTSILVNFLPREFIWRHAYHQRIATFNFQDICEKCTWHKIWHINDEKLILYIYFLSYKKPRRKRTKTQHLQLIMWEQTQWVSLCLCPLLTMLLNYTWMWIIRMWALFPITKVQLACFFPSFSKNISIFFVVLYLNSVYFTCEHSPVI